MLTFLNKPCRHFNQTRQGKWLQIYKFSTQDLMYEPISFLQLNNKRKRQKLWWFVFRNLELLNFCQIFIQWMLCYSIFSVHLIHYLVHIQTIQNVFHQLVTPDVRLPPDWQSKAASRLNLFSKSMCLCFLNVSVCTTKNISQKTYLKWEKKSFFFLKIISQVRPELSSSCSQFTEVSSNTLFNTKQLLWNTHTSTPELLKKVWRRHSFSSAYMKFINFFCFFINHDVT